MEQGTQTLAERRAEIRRRKILEQGKERMSKILGKETDLPGPVSSSSRHPAALPGRDLAIDASSDLIASLSMASGGTSGNFSFASISPDEISDQLSNLSLGFPNTPTAASAVTTATTTSDLFAQSSQRPSSPSTSPKYYVLCHLLLMLAAATAGLVYDQSILTSFLMLQPVLFALSFSCRSIPNLSLIPLVRAFFDNLLIFIFLSVMMMITRDVVVLTLLNKAL